MTRLSALAATGEPAASPLSDSHTRRIIVIHPFPAEWDKLQTIESDRVDLGVVLVFLAPLIVVGLAFLVALYCFYSKQTAAANAGSAMTMVEMVPLSQDPDLLYSDRDDDDIESEGEGEGEACAICLYRLRAEEPKYSMPCHHDYFHARCIKKWMAIRNVCPICIQVCTREDATS